LTIAIVLEIFLPTVNGVITTSINLARNLKKRGHKVIFIVPSWNKFSDKEVNGIPVFYIPSIPTHIYQGIRLISPFNHSMKKIIKKERVGIVHITGSWLLGRSAIISAGSKKIPVVHTFHTLIYKDTYLYYALKSRKLVPILRALVWKYIGYYVKRSDIMTAPSQYSCDMLKIKFPKSDVRHIRNGIELADFEKYDNYETFKLKYPDFNNKSFIFVGRLGEEKSVSVLIEAFRKALQKDPELRLYVIGDGPGRNSYEHTVENNNIEKSVKFLGRMDHNELITCGLYHHSRALVTASITENQPMTVIEAIACNIPVIIPDVGGIKELLSDNGLFVKADDTDDFAKKILIMAQDDEVFNACKSGGLRHKKEFDGMRIAEEFELIYQELNRNQN
jgi:glycosyltransferase involved in cell wall biosynthesis